MNQSDDKVGSLMLYLTQHMQSMLMLLEWSTAFHKTLKGQDKQKINLAMSRVQLAMRDVISISADPQQQIEMLQHVKNDDRQVYYVTLTQQLFDLTEEELKEITDIIDNYFINKHKTTAHE